jgi:glycosyltransferase involved in cell wall biosynthesis
MKDKRRCLYIVPNSPISPNYVGGGGAIYYEQLLSLAELGVEVHLWHFCYESRRDELERFIAQDHATWNYVRSTCKSVHRSNIPDTPSIVERVTNKLSNKITGFEIRNPVLRGRCYPILQKLVQETKPDFIWAQHLVSAQLALLQHRVPVVYSHHDWLYRIKSINNQNGLDIDLKPVEEDIARRSAAVVSGSRIECNKLEEIRCRNVHYIPVAYDEVVIPAANCADDAQIVHLGGVGTTATRVGMERFIDSVWGNLDLSGDRMMVIGDMNSASDKIKNFLSGVRTTGFVKDLSSVLRPYDIHVIPWEHETGQRTRLVRAFSFKQTVIATRKSVACFPEAVCDHNCVLVDSLDDMPRLIKRLLNDRGLREYLGDNARRTFETSFTRRVLLPKYQTVIESLGLTNRIPSRESSLLSENVPNRPVIN